MWEDRRTFDRECLRVFHVLSPSPGSSTRVSPRESPAWPQRGFRNRGGTVTRGSQRCSRVCAGMQFWNFHTGCISWEMDVFIIKNQCHISISYCTIELVLREALLLKKTDFINESALVDDIIHYMVVFSNFNRKLYACQRNLLTPPCFPCRC